MKIKQFEDSLFWWLEEIQVDEIECEQAREIVNFYRKGDYDVTEASERLELFCREPIQNWINRNKEIQQMLKQIKDE